ncbi:hypothetical protein KAFR_0B05600 [Kazachstania africana CBS 2517]|uniref:Uncharacterized protein n=1 Tax=Kazachstania africana (strain ATCC 22294 / BCRC 22015 / CBS 2517 / CECT 1963 / NBRC 1671 / NRRL Y-8276) TaxID=1071382 RepID=H2AR55_KAZAF|nr:hypothetical protein KAFR_0B05600 [Kazachstania africana CBS 2517]CCF56855.1 hypothetical protein KAFR_0B05600 [Kazachstania africana CBS 2517]
MVHTEMNETSSNVFKRLQISPSKNSRIKKPAMRLSPKKITTSAVPQYTPMKISSPECLKRYTRSLDRTGTINVAPKTVHLSPVRTHASLRSSHGVTIVSPIRANLQDQYSKDELKEEVKGSNLLTKLKDEFSGEPHGNEATYHAPLPQNSDSNTRSSASQPKKAVKFALSNENSTEEDLRSLIEQMKDNQLTLEKKLDSLTSEFLQYRHVLEEKVDRLLDENRQNESIKNNRN